LCHYQAVVGAADSVELRHALVEKLLRDGHLRSPRLADAFTAVPRELFVPDVPLEEAYRSSEAIIVKRIDGVGVSSASAPDVMALMLEQLDPRPGQRVLEIGAGTGYNAALLARVVGPAGSVVTVDIDDDLVAAAQAHLNTSGARNVRVVCSDGALGYPTPELFDRIILTVAARDIAPAWREQLVPETGRLVLPLVLRGPQRCVAFVNRPDCLVSADVRGCSFMQLRGLLAPEPQQLPLNPEGSLAITQRADDAPAIDIGTVAGSLVGPMLHKPTGVMPRTERVREGLELWLAVHDRAACALWSAPGPASPLPHLFGSPERFRATLGLVDASGAAVLAWCHQPGQSNELCVRAPAAADALAERMREHVQAWDAAGQPSDADLHIRAYPSASRPQPEPGEIVVDQRWTRFVLRWSQPDEI
jgi:protein-L-isoaspartate(D-aspartate) O-methyltransferase